MTRFIRDLRLIPIAVIASACLLVLKTADLFLHSSYFAANYAAPLDGEVSVIRPVGDATAPPGAMLSWAKQMFDFPDGNGAAAPGSSAVATNITPHFAPTILADNDAADITGSVPAEAASGDAKKPPDAKQTPDAKTPDLPGAKAGKAATPVNGVLVPAEGVPSGAERAILERLQERRQELDTRARELDIRESLIQGAEKRVDAQLTELKDTEARIKVETQQKDDAESARLKGLITMYENMKPRDAAKIFNGLDSAVLLQVASQMNPRTMSEILAQMSADVAQRLTVEMASKAQQVKAGGLDGLPKIQGQPTLQ